MKYKYILLIVLLVFISLFSYYYLNNKNQYITEPYSDIEKIQNINYTLDKNIILKLINQN